MKDLVSIMMDKTDVKYLAGWINSIEIHANGCIRDRNEMDKVLIQADDIQVKIRWIKEVLQDLKII